MQTLRTRPEAWVDFMMRFELGLEEPAPRHDIISAATIAGAYIAGGLIPLSPYFFADQVNRAVGLSAAVTLAALLVFGYVRGRFTGAGPLRSALQTALVGGLAAGAALLLARAIAH